MLKDPHIKEAKQHMQKTMDVFREELAGIRTNRVSPALIEKVEVMAYGQPMELRQVALISVQGANTLVIQPFDQSIHDAIFKALEKANLGAMPTSDGKVIRLTFPPMSEERRQEMVKLAHKYAEEARIAIRNIRRDILKDIDGKKKEGEYSEDMARRLKDEIQKVTDEFIGKIDSMLEKKEKEIME